MKDHLAIEFSQYGASFVALSNRNSVDECSIEFNSSQSDVIKDLLNRTFAENSFLSKDFEEITLAWHSNKSTLVPNTIFAESDPSSIFNLCFGKKENAEEIDYNRISEAGVVNIFEIPLWVKSFFVIKFPRIVIQHMGTHTLRQSLGNNAFKLKSTIIICRHFFQLSIVKHNQLQFYSFFDAQSAEDVIYHLMFTLQQKELSQEKGIIELVNGVGKDESFLSEIQDGIKKIKELSGFKVNLVTDFIPKAQELCV